MEQEAAAVVNDSVRLYEAFESFREPVLTRRRFRQEQILPLIERRRRDSGWEVTTAGYSFEGRPVQMLKTGKGRTKILLWSQMHGDEPTATMALFDIFNFFDRDDPWFAAFKHRILSEVTLYFVPMLNPDGAERYQRQTAQMIDMNRDALALQTPEGRILKGLIEDLKPEFGFNLHDQNPRYTAGKSGKLATISFLATSYDEALSVNDVRLRSMQLIAAMNEVLQQFIPGQVGRFSDEHEPRAFGDNIQKWGTTLVLVESGGYAGDPEKQYVRKLNFVALLTGLAAIADRTYARKQIGDYEAIPKNERNAYDLIIRGVGIEMAGKTFFVDIGIDRVEKNGDGNDGFTVESSVEEMGDLRTKSGIEEYSGSGLLVDPASVPLALGDRADFLLMRDGKPHAAVENGVVIASRI